MGWIADHGRRVGVGVGSTVSRGSARRLALLLGTLFVVLVALPSTASADPRQTDLQSIGPSGGNGAFDATWAGASQDGSKVFFVTNESLVAADTDTAGD